MSKKKRYSIVVRDLTVCYVCERHPVEVHHIFGGPNRDYSEKYHLLIGLCHDHHNEPPNGIHFNKNFKRRIQKMAQESFERTYPGLKFTEIFGMNYKEIE